MKSRVSSNITREQRPVTSQAPQPAPANPPIEEPHPDIAAQRDSGVRLGHHFGAIDVRPAASGLAPLQRLEQPRPDDEDKTVRQANQADGAEDALAASAGGAPNETGLPDTLKNGIETLSGLSLDNVDVHYNSAKPAEVQALAYTQGADIHVAPGQEQHLPHEAWHVVQQKQGRVQPTLQMKGVNINDDQGLEREADVMGAKALQMTRSEQTGALSTPQIPISLQQRKKATPSFSAFSAPKAAGTKLHERQLTEVIEVGHLEVVQGVFGAQDSLKLQIAHLIEGILKNFKIPAYLGGGAAAAVLGSGRAIKDLDYKMSEAFQEKWRDASQQDEITNDIVSELERTGLAVNVTEQNNYVLRMQIDNPSGVPIEISFTSTGSYSDIGTEQVEVRLANQNTSTVTLISRDALLLDKLFAFAERSVFNLDKLATDFIDIVTVLNANPYPYMSAEGLEERWVAYRKKWKRENEDPYDSGYLQMAPTIGLQVAMRTTLLMQNQHLRAVKDLRWIRLGSQMVGKLAIAVEKVAKADRLVLRDEILSGIKGDVGNKAFQELPKREQSKILQKLAHLQKKKESLEKRGRTKTSEYSYADARLFDLWLEWGIDLNLV